MCMHVYVRVCVCVVASSRLMVWAPLSIMHAMMYTNDSVYGVGVHGCAGGVIGPVLVHHAVEALQ